MDAKSFNFWPVHLEEKKMPKQRFGILYDEGEAKINRKVEAFTENQSHPYVRLCNYSK
jgi:hypothetical protein